MAKKTAPDSLSAVRVALDLVGRGGMRDGEKRKGDGTIYSKKIIGSDLIFNSKCVKTRLVAGLRLDLLVNLSFSRRSLAALNGQ